MPERGGTPYGAFNFTVVIGQDAEFGHPMGGFSDVSGLSTELTVAEYRNGNDPENHVHKVPGIHKVGDVTLKRGIVNSKVLWDWIDETRKKGVRAQRNVIITLLDETHAPKQNWELRNVIPLKYTGPTLAGKGGGDVAMEELVLSAEGLEVQAVS